MTDTRTISELVKAKVITTEQVDAAVEAYLANDSTGAFEIAPGLTVNLSEAIERCGPTPKVLTDAGSSETYRRTMVRAAIRLSDCLVDGSSDPKVGI